jgi:formylmethanofuran dehydrogenase subunit C
MSESVTLTLRAPVDGAIEVDGVTADGFATLGEREIALLPVWAGARTATLGDFFTVRGGHSAHVRVEGSLSRVSGIGAAMAGGELIIDGDAGGRVCAGMTGGSADIRGSVQDDAGVAMAGGILLISGNAGDRLGAAVPGASKGMTGGEIVVRGSAGSDAAARARRGLVVVGGHVGSSAARAMIAGTLVVLGKTGDTPGRGSKRGTIIAIGGIDVPVTYWLACTFEPPHVRLTMTYLRRRYGLAIDDAIVGGAYRRYCGDAGDQGRGEILEWVGPRRN